MLLSPQIEQLKLNCDDVIHQSFLLSQKKHRQISGDMQCAKRQLEQVELLLIELPENAAGNEMHYIHFSLREIKVKVKRAERMMKRFTVPEPQVIVATQDHQHVHEHALSA